MADDTLLDDLMLASGHVVTSALNELQPDMRKALMVAMSKGAELELRIRAIDPAQVSLWLVAPGKQVLFLTLSGAPAH